MPRPPIFNYRITDYDRRLVPSTYVAELDRGAVDPAAWVATTGHSIGHPGWGLVYHLMLTLLDPHRTNFVIETGTNVGSTSLMIAQAIADSERRADFHTIEIDPEVYTEARRRFAEAGLSVHIVAHCGNSLDVLPGVLANTDRIDVAFLDGNHRQSHVISEFALVEPKLGDHGVAILDNTYLIADDDSPDQRVNGALRCALRDFGGHLVNLPFCSWYTPGIAIWQRQPFDNMEPPH